MSRERMQMQIERAERAVREGREKAASGPMRQRYHFMAETGWLNDPNGLIFYKGCYHFFYQYNPYGAFWDSMHWGHAVSKDLVHWEYLPLALAPSEEYDDHPQGGCFSGTAIEHEGKLYLFYTAVANYGQGLEQSQCVAFSEDGIHFEKYEGNPVIVAPEGVRRDQFRDPKVFRLGEKFYLLVAACLRGRGQALLYESKDLLHWSLRGPLAENRGEWGWMWECPDFFPVGDKYVLTCSPTGVGDHTAIYQVGEFDGKRGRFFPERTGEMDWGFEFYAPQSFEAPDGRRITVGWAGQWQWMPLFKDWGPTYKEGWCGFFNLPREVRISEDQRPCFVPVKELETLREGGFRLSSLKVGDQPCHVPAGDGVSFEMKFRLDLEKTDARALQLRLRDGEGRFTLVKIDLSEAEILVDRSHADGWSVGVSRCPLLLKGKKELDVHLFSDQSSLEIFADGYRSCSSNNIYASDDQNGISFLALGGEARIFDIETYGMKSSCNSSRRD